MTIYNVKGLNFDKFLQKVRTSQLPVRRLQKSGHDEFQIAVDEKYVKTFLLLTSTMNYKVKELSISPFHKFLRFLRSNLAFVLCVCLIVMTLPFAMLFVSKTEIYGLKTINKQQILQVLAQNGYNEGKLRFDYDLKNIEKVLVTNLPSISLASAIIKGNTLVINVREMIDNSAYLYDYEPITAPIDCVIESIDLISGLVLKKSGDIAKAGEVVVSPKVKTSQGKELSIPAKAEIVASFDLSQTFFVKNDSGAEYKKKLFGENKNMLYNIMSNMEILGEPLESNKSLVDKDGTYYTICFSGRIKF